MPQPHVRLWRKHLDPRALVDLELLWYFALANLVCLEAALEFLLQIGQNDLVGLCFVNLVHARNIFKSTSCPWGRLGACADLLGDVRAFETPHLVLMARFVLRCSALLANFGREFWAGILGEFCSPSLRSLSSLSAAAAAASCALSSRFSRAFAIYIRNVCFKSNSMIFCLYL